MTNGQTNACLAVLLVGVLAFVLWDARRSMPRETMQPIPDNSDLVMGSNAVENDQDGPAYASAKGNRAAYPPPLSFLIPASAGDVTDVNGDGGYCKAD